MITCYGFTDIGLASNENQDSIFYACDGDKGLFVVADGMGGHADGARASRTIKGFAEDWWSRKEYQKMNFFEVVDTLKDMLYTVNSTIFNSTPQGYICGSTVVLLWVDGDGYALITVGDSRCYRVTDNEPGDPIIEIISTDDVWENNIDNIRGLSEAEILNHPNYGKLSRAVGAKPDFTCTVRCDCIDHPTLFAICSDGIYKYVNEQLMYSELELASKTGDLETCCRIIKEDIYAGGAPDNMSLLLLGVGKKK